MAFLRYIYCLSLHCCESIEHFLRLCVVTTRHKCSLRDNLGNMRRSAVENMTVIRAGGLKMPKQECVQALSDSLTRGVVVRRGRVVKWREARRSKGS